MNTSPVGYFRLGACYPRRRLREPYPRRLRRFLAAMAYVPPPAATQNVFGAIRERMEATTEIMALLEGGANGPIYRGVADADAWDAPPFAVLSHVGGDRDDTATALWYLQRDLCQVQFYGTDPDVLDALSLAWEDAFNREMEPMAVRRMNGVTVVSRPPVYRDDNGKTPGGLVLTQLTIEFTAFGSRG